MRTLFIICFILISNFVLAQDDAKKEHEFGWTKQVVGDLNFTQNAFTDWQQGGEDSWSWALNLNAKFENDQEKFNWASSGKLAYGQASIGNSDPRKAADEIKLESVYTHKLGAQVNPYAAVSLLTQLTEGRTYVDANDNKGTVISNFFDPGYITESVGAGYKPNETIKTRIGLAVKQTFSSKYGYADDPETAKIEKFKNEIGAESVTDLNYKLSEQILYESEVSLFSNFKAVNQIDVNWDNNFSAKISEIIKVSFNFRLLYDRDIFYKRQIKQTLAVGMSYSFL